MSDASPERVADKDAIRDLLSRYCFHLDNDRFEDMAALFTPDGIWDTAFGTGTGRAGIVAQAGRIAAGSRPPRVHLTTNIVIEPNGDRAAARSNWLPLQKTSSAPAIGSAGAYEDRLVRQDRRWFFEHRKIDRCIADGRD